jgi:hypothetical protein
VDDERARLAAVLPDAIDLEAHAGARSRHVEQDRAAARDRIVEDSLPAGRVDPEGRHVVAVPRQQLQVVRVQATDQVQPRSLVQQRRHHVRGQRRPVEVADRARAGNDDRQGDFGEAQQEQAIGALERGLEHGDGFRVAFEHGLPELKQLSEVGDNGAEPLGPGPIGLRHLRDLLTDVLQGQRRRHAVGHARQVREDDGSPALQRLFAALQERQALLQQVDELVCRDHNRTFVLRRLGLENNMGGQGPGVSRKSLEIPRACGVQAGIATSC